MTNPTHYPLLTARGIPIEPAPNGLDKVSHNIVHATLTVNELCKLRGAPFEAKDGHWVWFAGDVERFLSSLPGEE